jgi:hypothetical protein
MLRFRFRFMVLNATFNNISVILWQSVLLVEETGVHGENHRPVPSVTTIACIVLRKESMFKNKDIEHLRI